MDIAYIAGFFDGEGCVGIKRSGNSHQVYATIGQTRVEILKNIQARFGGSIRWNKNIWILWMSSKIAMRFLEAIYPHTIVKKAEIRLALEAFKEMTVDKKRGVPQHLRDLRERNMKAIVVLRNINLVDYSTTLN